jgi:hypothetical protein
VTWTKPRTKAGALVLVFLVTISSFVLTAGSVRAADDFDFRIEAGHASIFDYHGEGENVFIPSTLGGNPVTRIEEFAFYNKGLSYVEIPDSVTEIDNHAFADNQLYAVKLGQGIIRISNEAFYQNDMTSIMIPDGVEIIGEFAFFGNQLTKVIIPPSVTGIGIAAFDANKGKTEGFTIYGVSGSAAEIYATANRHTFIPITYSGDYSYIIEDGKAVIMEYKGTGGNVEIPVALGGHPVVKIEEGAFQKKGLTSIVIPDSIIRIGDGAFAFNHDLTWAIIGQSVTIIGNYAFTENRLSELRIPDHVINIGEGAFNNNALEHIEIGSGVESIGSYAFMGNQLTSIMIPRSVTSMGSSAFMQNELASVTISNPAMSIGETQFTANQEKPEDVTIYGILGSTADTYASDNGHTFVAIEETDDDDDSSMMTIIYYGLGLLVLVGGVLLITKRKK